jgi:hypothetical protein
MTNEDWQHPNWRQLRDRLQAAAPKKRKKRDLFAMVPLLVAADACKAMHSSKAMVWIWLLHKVRMAGGRRTVAVPNGALAALGVGPDAKARALRQLEAAGLITVEWRLRKTPIATLL